MTEETKYSREAIMELVHRFAGDDRLEEFDAALDAFERSATYHWKTEFQECHDELTETRKVRDNLAALLRVAVYRLRRDAKDSKPAQTHREKCVEYLTRNGLQGSPLR